METHVLPGSSTLEALCGNGYIPVGDMVVMTNDDGN